MKGELTIRPMTQADTAAVARLSGELGYPSDADAVRRRLRAVDPADLLIVAVSDHSDPVGFIHATTVHTVEADARVHIVGLVVSPAVRRAGIARKLIGEVERWAAATGAEAIVVRSNTARGEAHEFYPAVGYTRIKTQAVYLKKLTE
ncbi:GNAT family N-acetyltransferase [soil metagenome]